MTEWATIFHCYKAIMAVPNIVQVSGRCDVPAGVVEHEVGMALKRSNTQWVLLELTTALSTSRIRINTAVLFDPFCRIM